MARRAKILVVEDEGIVAKDIADTLKKQGYDVPAIAFSGEGAVEKAGRVRPDLVLMDIVLKGRMDGIEAAGQIRERFGIPVLYLTAHTDDETIKRAKITEPFAYITKPFEARELRTNIEIALYRHKAERKILDYQAQLKSLASELALAEERERRRIARKLHDGIGQSLAISKLGLDKVRGSESSAALGQAVKEASESIEQIISEVSSLSFDLSSPIPYDLGLEAAVADWLDERMAKDYGIATEFEDDGQPKPLDADIIAVLFRDVRELLMNVVKHAGAKKVKLSIGRVGGRIRISVEDDGCGFDPAAAAANAVKNGGFGLFSVRERLEQLGGSVEIDSAPGSGTRVTVTAPLKCEEASKVE
ncbi:MAG: response regulator [Phycisphaerae bacterium]|nr:response regulator [Phycisphaerae bacterium]